MVGRAVEELRGPVQRIDQPDGAPSAKNREQRRVGGRRLLPDDRHAGRELRQAVDKKPLGLPIDPADELARGLLLPVHGLPEQREVDFGGHVTDEPGHRVQVDHHLTATTPA